ncbi:MAG: hypothetical protein HOC74_38580 [Gemmatimonadetes bacterium]|nr:hypothetical protein [Gemmatimonadota bacterium]
MIVIAPVGAGGAITISAGGRCQRGWVIATGMYLVQLRAGEFCQVCKVAFVK